MMRLTTVGRRSGQPRVAIIGYYEDGPNLVTLAMNGWADAEPAWWLNLQAQPDTTVELKDGARAVRARGATIDRDGGRRARAPRVCRHAISPTPSGSRIATAAGRR
jgi:deazaflavin-dependent oxidoreductase (nitroreductase family)